MQNIFIVTFLNFLSRRKYRVGFVIPGRIVPYKRSMASTRLRVYDPILYSYNNSNKYLLEFYNPLWDYDILVFQKIFDEKALEIAKRAKARGTKIILDLNVNFFDEVSQIIGNDQRRQVKDFINFADYVITTSPHLKEKFAAYFPGDKIRIIEENIINYGVRKEIRESDISHTGVNLTYVGYSPKVKDLLLIKKALKKLSKKLPVTIYAFSEKDVDLDFEDPNIKFVCKRYNQFTIFDDLCVGDIYIAPRDLNETYNLGHSFNKIGQPMSIGLPVIASPVPSYQKSPAILLETMGDEWREEILRLMKDREYYKAVSEQGVKFCDENYSSRVIMDKYLELFQKNLTKE